MRRTRTKTLIQLAVSALVALTMMGAFFAVGGLTGGHSQIVLAKGKGGTRPGWGCGDTNHTHTGPPGNTSMTSPCKSTSGSTTSTTSSTTSSTTAATTAGTVGGTGTQATSHTKKSHTKKTHTKKSHTKKNKTKKTHTSK